MLKVHVVVSGIQAFTTNPTLESWGHFPKELERLVNLLETKRQQNMGLATLLPEWRHPSCQNLRISTIWITRGHVQWLDASLRPAQIPWTLVPAHFISISSTSQSSRTRRLFHWTQSWSHPNRLGTRHECSWR
jgi:hypothetical protein